MKKKVIMIIGICILLIVLISVIIVNQNKKLVKNKVDDGKIHILTSFYPLYIMTKNLTNGVDNIEVENMSEKNVGCIHDYTLTTDDLKKFINADLFIQNGAGLESFTKKITEQYPNVKIVNLAENVKDFITNENGEKNGHVWLNIENYENELKTLEESLEEIDNTKSAKFESNLDEYFDRLDKLRANYLSLNNLEGKKAIVLDESLQYLINEIGIKDITIITDHEQSALSANQIKEIVQEIKDQNITMIFIEKSANSKTADMIANETNAKVYKLDSGMTGDSNNLNSYIDVMKSNYEILNKTYDSVN